MRCRPGHCAKCDCSIANGPNASSLYVEDEFELDNGNHLFVGRCIYCDILPQEYGEVLDAVNAALAPHPLEGKIVKRVGSKGFVDLLKQSQGNRCRCGNELDSETELNGFEVLCGKCGPFNAATKTYEKREKLKLKSGKGKSNAGKVAAENKPVRRAVGNVILRKMQGKGGGNKVSEKDDS